MKVFQAFLLFYLLFESKSNDTFKENIQEEEIKEEIKTMNNKQLEDEVIDFHKNIKLCIEE